MVDHFMKVTIPGVCQCCCIHGCVNVVVYMGVSMLLYTEGCVNVDHNDHTLEMDNVCGWTKPARWLHKINHFSINVQSPLSIAFLFVYLFHLTLTTVLSIILTSNRKCHLRVPVGNVKYLLKK